MTINEVMIQAVTPIVPVCVPDEYAPAVGEEAAEIYCVFDYTETPDSFGDDRPQAVRYVGMLHLYLPSGENPLKLKRQLREALLDAGFAVGDTTNASDADGQHYAMDFEWADGGSA